MTLVAGQVFPPKSCYKYEMWICGARYEGWAAEHFIFIISRHVGFNIFFPRQKPDANPRKVNDRDLFFFKAVVLKYEVVAKRSKCSFCVRSKHVAWWIRLRWGIGSCLCSGGTRAHGFLYRPKLLPPLRCYVGLHLSDGWTNECCP